MHALGILSCLCQGSRSVQLACSSHRDAHPHPSPRSFFPAPLLFRGLEQANNAWFVSSKARRWHEPRITPRAVMAPARTLRYELLYLHRGGGLHRRPGESEHSLDEVQASPSTADPERCLVLLLFTPPEPEQSTRWSYSAIAYRRIAGERLMTTVVDGVSSPTLSDASCPYRQARI